MCPISFVSMRGCQVESQEKMAVEQKHISQELPKILIAYKSHVLYALERYLTQSEALVPGGKGTMEVICS